MRVYLPSTLPTLAAALAAGEIGPAPLTGYAVTPALREWYVGGDLEELEYAAMLAAARASLRLLALDPDAPLRRVVLAVELPEEAVSYEPGDAALTARIAAEMQRHGVYVTAFSFPVVPRGEARIRVQLSAVHTEGQIRRCVSAFAAARQAVASG